jgi:hypothetical protein
MKQLKPIKFKNVDHLITEIKKHLDPKFKHGTRRIVAALLSLWRWEQDKTIANPKQIGISQFCALCILNHWCSQCIFPRALKRTCVSFIAKDNQRIIDALQKAVLHEIVSVYGDMCVEVVQNKISEAKASKS